MMRKRSFASALCAWLLALGAMANAQDAHPTQPETSPLDTHAPALDEPLPHHKDTGLTVGVGFYFLKPTWASNPAYQSNTTVIGGPPTFQFNSSVDFGYAYSLTPRVFASYAIDCGLAARVSWWKFDQSASKIGFTNPFSAEQNTVISGPGNNPGTTSTFSPVNNFALTPGDKDDLVFTNRLVLDVYDLDVSLSLVDSKCWDFTVGMGVRYAHIAQYYDAISVRTSDTLPNRINTREVHIVNQLSAAGPDLFAEARRSFGGVGLAVYGNVRGGLLFGSGNYTQQSISRIVPGQGFIPNRTDRIDRNVAGLSFLESELGLEWQGRGIGRFKPILRVGVVGQNWFGLGNALSSSGNTNTLSNLGLFGGTFMGGFNF